MSLYSKGEQYRILYSEDVLYRRLYNKGDHLGV